ncbi:hypothetical protein [Streptomyces sp. 4N124]|uniref:hypothetical protein n=1 Tax=Streptomyces sp. 4N124 TaxID=3457420 RepID=UPI003FD6417A
MTSTDQVLAKLATGSAGPHVQRFLVFLFDPAPGDPMSDETPLPGFESITVTAHGTRPARHGCL